jgi:tRNA pseudouridine55 synthase
MFSAKKINGQRLYSLARQGIEIERKPSDIEIYAITLLEYTWPILRIEVQCSAGTYIRSLAHDIGKQLGTGAFCQELVRTKIGDHTITQAISII